MTIEDPVDKPPPDDLLNGVLSRSSTTVSRQTKEQEALEDEFIAHHPEKDKSFLIHKVSPKDSLPGLAVRYGVKVQVIYVL
jgi:LysM repeat protein